MVNNKLLVAIVVLSILQGHSALPQVKREAKPQDMDLAGLLSGVLNTGLRVFSSLASSSGGDTQKFASDLTARALPVITSVSKTFNTDSGRSARGGGSSGGLLSILGFGNGGGGSSSIEAPKADLSSVPEPSFDDIPENVF